MLAQVSIYIYICIYIYVEVYVNVIVLSFEIVHGDYQRAFLDSGRSVDCFDHLRNSASQLNAINPAVTIGTV